MKRTTSYDAGTSVDTQTRTVQSSAASKSASDVTKMSPSLSSSPSSSEGSGTLLVPIFTHLSPPRQQPRTMPSSHAANTQPLENLRLTIGVYDDLPVFHHCMNDEIDPFVGIVNKKHPAVRKCCAMKGFIDVAHGSFDEPLLLNVNLKNVLTAYGERMFRINGLTIESEAWVLHLEYWHYSEEPLSLENLFEFLKRSIPPHLDDDRVEWSFDSCSVCLANLRFVRKPSCCRQSICQLCWQQYVRNYAEISLNQRLNGIYDLHCFSCDKLVRYSEALACTNPSEIELIRPNNISLSASRCPYCLVVPEKETKRLEHFENLSLNDKNLAIEFLRRSKFKKRRIKGGHPIVCHRCSNTYCLTCGAKDLHPKMTCQELIGTDLGLRKWTREKSLARADFPNGRFCPTCHIPVSHSGGCPQMMCTCGTTFCYKCGHKYFGGPLSYIFPSHSSSRYIPVISCPKMWKSKPKRIVVHTLVGTEFYMLGCSLPTLSLSLNALNRNSYTNAGISLKTVTTFDDDTALIYKLSEKPSQTLRRSRSFGSFSVPNMAPVPSLSQPVLLNDDEVLRTPSLSSENSRYYLELFDRILTFVPSPDESIHKNCLECLKVDDDPFVGVLDSTTVILSCCYMRCYLDHVPSSPTFKDAFTPFGTVLLNVTLMYDVDLRSRLSGQWRRNWISLGVDGLHRHLRGFTRHTDEEGVTWAFDECSVCLAPCRYVRRPPCCQASICQNCWTCYIRETAESSYTPHYVTPRSVLRCYSCQEIVPYNQALACTEKGDLIYIRPPGQIRSRAVCPTCLTPAPSITDYRVAKAKTEKNEAELAVATAKKLRRKKGGKTVTCSLCKRDFCGICGNHAHLKVSCQQLISSDASIKQWAKQKSSVRPHFQNGRFCPSCGTPVTHSGGCPHMICPCGVSFCYLCGRKHFKFMRGFLPSHNSSKLIPFITCPKLWSSQTKRIVVHSLVSFGFIFGAVPVFLIATPIALPLILSTYVVKKIKRKFLSASS